MRDIFDDTDLAIEQAVENFESSWNASTSKIEEFLPLDGVLRTAVLHELIAVDLELRTKDGQSARVEEYLDRFPEVASDADAVAQLIRTEYELRVRREPKLDWSEFRQRFPDHVKTAKLGSVTGGPFPDPPPPDDFGDTSTSSGRFRLIRHHDEGGLGNIWFARDEELERHVAIKEMKTRYVDDEESVSRFQNEAHITARLEHPGIIPVYGKGQQRDGRPFYAMRFVGGKTLRAVVTEYHETDWTRQPTGKQNLELRRLIGHLIDACHTLHYAHQQGVLHRDVKPDNIMVGEYGETLIVDWGLAKVMSTERTAKLTAPVAASDTTWASSGSTSPATSGGMLGSPNYMSPEQARQEHETLSPESDIYSLGATLYVMLCDRRPPAHKPNPDEPGALLDNGVPRPTAIKPGAPAAAESICLKAMSFEPEQRYHGADEMAQDLERFLADESVDAHQESLLERTVRLIRRHRAAVVMALAGLLAMTLVSTLAAVKINGQRNVLAQGIASEKSARAEADAAKAETQVVLEMFVNSLGTPVPEREGRDVRVVEVLARTVENAKVQLQDDPVALAKVLDNVARTYFRLGVLDSALATSSSAVETIGRCKAEHPITWIEANITHGTILSASGETSQAIDRLEKTREDALSRGLSDSPVGLSATNALALAHLNVGDAETAVNLLEPIWLPSPDIDAKRPITQQIAINLSHAYLQLGRIDEALSLGEMLKAFALEIYGAGHPTTDLAVHNLADIHENHVDQLQSLVNRLREVEGPQHPRTTAALNSLAIALMNSRRAQEATPILREIFELRRGKGGFDYKTLQTANDLAESLHREEKFQEACDLNGEILPVIKSEFPKDTLLYFSVMNNLANNLDGLGRLEEAMPLWLEAEQGLRSSRPKGDKHTLVAVLNLSTGFIEIGQTDKIVEMLDEAVADSERSRGAEDIITLQLRAKQAEAAMTMGDFDKAADILRDVVAKSEEHVGIENHRTHIQRLFLGEALNRTGDFQASEASCRQTCKDIVARWEGSAQASWARINWAEALFGLDRPEETQELLEIALAQSEGPSGNPKLLGHVSSLMGEYALRTQEYELAEKALLRTQECYAKSLDGRYSFLLPENLERLVRLYGAWGKPKDAAKWQAKLKENQASAAVNEQADHDDAQTSP